jgi:hypothetical protein
MSTILRWHGGFGLHELLTSETHRDNFSTPGVYLWIDNSRLARGVCYVGRATGAPDLWTRHWQHYTALIAGHYLVPAAARSDARDWGMDYKSSSVAEILFDEEQYVQLVRDCFAYAKQFSVFLCPLHPSLVKAIERQLLFDLQPFDTKWGTRSPPEVPVELKHETPNWMSEHIPEEVRSRVVVHPNGLNK